MIILERYLLQQARWPSEGRCILAQHDDESIVVYQAFRPDVADEALRLQRFGAKFGRNRMSWIKPNFLWMMFRSGWGTKPAQQAVVGVRLKRDFFERVLALAVPSDFESGVFADAEAWSAAAHAADARLQWDPDHDPEGLPTRRRALQLGLRGNTLREYASDAVLEVVDMMPVVEAGRRHAVRPFSELEIPLERDFSPRTPDLPD